LSPCCHQFQAAPIKLLVHVHDVDPSRGSDRREYFDPKRVWKLEGTHHEGRELQQNVIRSYRSPGLTYVTKQLIGLLVVRLGVNEEVRPPGRIDKKRLQKLFVVRCEKFFA
jgi:hypothetical protein